MRDPFDEISVVEILRVLWRRRLVIAGVIAAGCVVSVIYALTLTHYFRAEAVVVEVRDQAGGRGVSGQLAGLASLAGINLGAMGGGEAHALAVLRSRSLAAEFVREMNVVEEFRRSADDDIEEVLEDPGMSLMDRVRSWFGHEPPAARDEAATALAREQRVVDRFVRNVRRINQDPQTGLIRVAMEWTSPEVATQWANAYVALANQRMRERAIAQAEGNLRYLNHQLQDTTIVELQQSLYGLIENELQTLMLANVRDEYSFRLIDHAVVPDEPAYPSRRMIAMGGGLISGLLALLAVFLLEFRQRAAGVFREVTD